MTTIQSNQLCFWYQAGISQRQNEIARGDDERGTTGWEDRGCYTECLGKDKIRSCYYIGIDQKVEMNIRAFDGLVNKLKEQEQ